jgi:hypothetical protein
MELGFSGIIFIKFENRMWTNEVLWTSCQGRPLCYSPGSRHEATRVEGLEGTTLASRARGYFMDVSCGKVVEKLNANLHILNHLYTSNRSYQAHFILAKKHNVLGRSR